MASKLNEGSEFTIPLKNLIAMIAFTGISVWGYFGIVERLAFLEHEQEMMIFQQQNNLRAVLCCFMKCSKRTIAKNLSFEVI